MASSCPCTSIIGNSLRNLPALRQIGFAAKLKFLRVIDAVLPQSGSEPAPPRDLPRCRGVDHGHREYIDKHNNKPKPFVWTARAARYPGEGQARSSDHLPPSCRGAMEPPHPGR